MGKKHYRYVVEIQDRPLSNDIQVFAAKICEPVRLVRSLYNSVATSIYGDYLPLTSEALTRLRCIGL